MCKTFKEELAAPEKCIKDNQLNQQLKSKDQVNKNWLINKKGDFLQAAIQGNLLA